MSQFLNQLIGIEPLVVKSKFQPQRLLLSPQLLSDLSHLYAGDISASDNLNGSPFSLTKERLQIDPTRFDSKSKKALWQALEQHNLLR